MSWRDTTSSRGSQDGSGGSMNARGGVSGTGGGSGEGARGPGGGLRGDGGNYRGGLARDAEKRNRGDAGGRRSAIPVPPVRRVAPLLRPPVQPPVAPPPVVNYLNPPRAFPARPVAPLAQRPPSTYVRSPYSNPATYTPRPINEVYGPRITGSTHYQTSGPESGSFQQGDPSASYGNDRFGNTLGDRGLGNGGRNGGVGGWAKGGNVDKPSVLQRIMARSKPKEAVKVTQRVTPKKAPTKTPWKKAGVQAFAKGGAVEKFMKRYPSFKLA